MQNKIQWQLALNFGAYYGLSAFAVFILMQATGSNPFGFLLIFLSGLLMIVWLSMVIKTLRDKHLGGFISYKDAFLTSLLTLLLASALYGILLYIDGIVIYPNLLDEYKIFMQSQTEQLTTMKAFESLAEQMEEEIDKTTLSQFAMSEFTSKSFWGTILCLILSAIFKRNKTESFLVDNEQQNNPF